MVIYRCSRRCRDKRAEPPKQNGRRHQLDQAINSKCREQQAAGGESRSDRHRSFDHHPGKCNIFKLKRLRYQRRPFGTVARCGRGIGSRHYLVTNVVHHKGPIVKTITGSAPSIAQIERTPFRNYPAGRSAGLFIIRNIAGPPVFAKRTTSNAASATNAILSQVV